MMAKGRAANICGLFLRGINDDRLTIAYRDYQSGSGFLTTPIWISGGIDDPIPTTGLEGQVAANIRRTGFKQVRRILGGSCAPRAMLIFGGEADFRLSV
jgi:hypothetical protein